MAALDDADWDLPSPFIKLVTAKADHIDLFGHVNNKVYFQWADEAAWANWQASGFDDSDCLDVDRGMAIMRSEADYLGHVREGDQIACAVWIPISDGRLRAERWYQFRKVTTGETVFRAVTKLVCFALSSGRPARMTGAFSEHYAKPEPALNEAALATIAARQSRH